MTDLLLNGARISALVGKPGYSNIATWPDKGYSDEDRGHHNLRTNYPMIDIESAGPSNILRNRSDGTYLSLTASEAVLTVAKH